MKLRPQLAANLAMSRAFRTALERNAKIAADVALLLRDARGAAQAHLPQASSAKPNRAETSGQISSATRTIEAVRRQSQTPAAQPARAAQPALAAGLTPKIRWIG